MNKGWAKTVCALLLCGVCAAPRGEPIPFKLRFDMHFAGLGAAVGSVQLERDGDRLLYTSTLTPSGLVAALFADKLRATARMRYEDNRIVAEEYATTYARNTEKNQRYRFESHGRSVEVLKEGRVYFLQVPAGTLDEVSAQLQLIEDAQTQASSWDYHVVSNGKLKRYRFTKIGNATLSTQFGEVGTVQIERTRLRDEKDDELDHRYWLSPAHHYLPIRVERIKDGNIRRTMTATHIDLPDRNSGGQR